MSAPRTHGYFLQFTLEHPEWRYVIYRLDEHGSAGDVLWNKSRWVDTFPYEGHDDPDEPPPAVREAYERLNGIERPTMTAPALNLVEMVAGADCAFDQPCAHGHRVEQHAVYCHNETWLYAPRKCKRSRNREDYRHEDCKGFRPNNALAEVTP